MIKEITETGFLSGVTLNSATVTFADMGERVITADVKIAGGASLGENAYITFRGEKFYPVVKDPQAVKNNERVAHVVTVNFQSEVIRDLKRYWFFKTPEQGTDVVVDTYAYPIALNLQDFVTLFNDVLSYYYGARIDMIIDRQTIDLSEHAEAVLVEVDYTTVWDVLTQMYERYGVRWRIIRGSHFTIELTNADNAISHVFSYGYEGGLTSIERQVQDEDIHNKIFGRGTDKNLPFYYFHIVPQGDTSGYVSDPDAIPELKDIYFSELRDAAFRWYVRGWMQNPNRDTSGDEAWDPGHVFPTYSVIPEKYEWAYELGMTDVKFNPVEYVKDDGSIERYGELWGKAEPNEDIYPTMKTPIVAYENTTPDEVSEVTAKESKLDVLDDVSRLAGMPIQGVGGPRTQPIYSNDSVITTEERPQNEFRYTLTLTPSEDEVENRMLSAEFDIDEGMTGSLMFNVELQIGEYKKNEDGAAEWNDRTTEFESRGWELTYHDSDSYYYVRNPQTGEYLMDGNERKVSPLNIPAGHWQIEFHICASERTPWRGAAPWNGPFHAFRILISNITLTIGVEGTSPYRLFNIWLPNLWNTEKGQNETDAEYVTRVWLPILGTDKEAAVVFASGQMTRSSDYEFKIAAPLLRGVEYDTSKSYNGTPSEWKLTLIKSEAEYQTDGMFIPRNGIAPAAGDIMFFADGSTVMPQSVVEDAEDRLYDYKVKVLNESKDIQPQWNIQLDKVRIKTLESGESATLYSTLDAGRKLTIWSDTLIPDGDHTRSMFIESLTITWSDDTIANPDVEVVLAHEIRVYHSPIETLHADIREVEITKVDEEEAQDVSRRVAARESIPSTGTEAAKASAPLTLANMLQSPDFRTGLLEGVGWSIYRDTFGNCVFETDKINVRKGLTAPSITIDEWKHQGGVHIMSAANMRITSIEDSDTYLRCFFDTQNGSVSNLFVEHDIVLCTRTNTSDGSIKSYRYEVVGVGSSYINLSKTNHAGDSAAVGDELIQYGNTQDANRQHVIIFDAASGHERMLFGLNSVTAPGDMYYYAGAIQQDGVERRRWFVGDKDGSRENFIEYAWNATTQSYVLTIGGDVYVGGGDVSLDTLNYLAASLHDNSGNGLILSNQIAVYTGTGAQARVMGGINGNSSTSQIAAWFGGAMTTEGYYAARVVFRFDGSGYVAGKHISWDAAGNCTIDGSVQLASGSDTISTLIEKVDGAVQKTDLASKGSNVRPVYFDEDAEAQVIDGLHVPENVEAGGGVSARGITDLGVSGGGGGTGGGVETVSVNGGTPVQPDPFGNVDLDIELADLPQDSTHRTVSDTEKSQWNAAASKTVVTYAGLDPTETESTGEVPTAKAVALVKDAIGLEHDAAAATATEAAIDGFEDYVRGREYKRGDTFRLVDGGGHMKAYRVKTDMTIFNWGNLQRINFKALITPLNITDTVINSMN